MLQARQLTPGGKKVGDDSQPVSIPTLLARGHHARCGSVRSISAALTLAYPRRATDLKSVICASCTANTIATGTRLSDVGVAEPPQGHVHSRRPARFLACCSPQRTSDWSEPNADDCGHRRASESNVSLPPLIDPPQWDL